MPRRVHSIGKPLLHKLLPFIRSVSKSHFDSSALKSILLLLYHGCFRIGELTCSNSLKNTIHICNVEVSFLSRFPSIVFTLSNFKHSKEPKRVSLSPAPGSPFCPVSSLLEYLLVRPPIEGPLFISPDGSPLTREFVASHLRKALTLCHPSPSLFNTHSLRVGRATDLAIEGVPDHIIRETGRWSSNAYLDYIRFPIFSLP